MKRLSYILCLLCWLTPAVSQGGDQPAKTGESLDIEGLLDFFNKKSSFHYRREGRADPFKPFITEAVSKGEQEVLTGLRRFEPGQLTLVAIVSGAKSPTAMVEDALGKGYIVRQGARIGKSGQIEEIKNDRIILRQRYRTASGGTKYRLIKMLLKKEGEQ